MTINTTTPAGVPSIPQGAQLGGEGTLENQAQAQQQQMQQQMQQQVLSPITANQELPPVNQELNPVPTAVPAENPNETVQVNPYNQTEQDVYEGATYVQTAIKHLSTELSVSDEAFESVYENALKYNDMALIDPKALGKDLTPEQAVRVKQLATEAVQEVRQGVQRAQTEVHTVAGGEAEWNTAVQAFNANASKQAQGYASYLADQGDFKGAAEYVLQFVRGGGHVNHVQQAPIAGSLGVVSTALSKAEYASELAKIEREAGNQSLGSPQFAQRINDLDARRALGRQQGL